MSGSELAAALERLRTRAGVTAAIAVTVPAAGLGWGLADLVRVLLMPGPPSRLAVTLPFTAAAAILAAAIAWLRRPDLAAVARASDRHLGLQASVVTAWQFHDATDAFALRTAARAVAGLRHAPASDVYPWRVSRTGLVAFVLGAGLAIGAAIAPTSRIAPGTATPMAGTGGAPSGPAQPGSPATARIRQRADAAPTATPPPATPAATTPSAVREAAKPAQPPTSADTASTGRTALTSASGRAGRESTAPGGGRSGGSGAAGSGAPSAGGDAITSRAQAGEVTRAPGLERVPMNRRAYVRRYLLSRAEPR